MKVNINRQAAGLEDLLFGVGTVEQIRQGTVVTVTKINANNLPFNETQSLAEALTPITEQIIPNLVEILAAEDNAGIATTKAVEASVSANNAHASELAAAISANNAHASELAAAASESQIASHLINTSNPHSVTKAQVGLSNVDNTADTAKNVLSASKLTIARTINGVSFDGTANITVADSTKVVANSAITAGTSTKVTYDAKGLVTAGTSLSASDIPSLDASKITSGVINAARLPSYVDDVIEGANLAAFPVTGETGKIYIALDTNKTYRWSGSAYVYITSGAVDSVAGKTGVVTLVKGDVGLGNVDNTSDIGKPISTAAQIAFDTKTPYAIVNEDSVVKLISLKTKKSWTKGFSGTGALQIELQGLYGFSLDGMMQVRIKETLGNSIIINIDGRWDASSTWSAYSATSDTSINVRFAKDSSKVYILIGDTSKVWGNTRVEIDNVMSNYNSGLSLDFAMSVVSSYPATVVAIVDAQNKVDKSAVVTTAITSVTFNADGTITIVTP